MCRTVTLVFLLAAVAASACGAQTSAAKTHRKASSARTAHHAAQSSRHTSHAKTSSQVRSASAHRASPDEVGRAAGLKIRSRMAQRSTAAPRSRTVPRSRRTRYTSRSRIRRPHVVPASLHETVHAYRSAPTAEEPVVDGLAEKQIAGNRATDRSVTGSATPSQAPSNAEEAASDTQSEPVDGEAPIPQKTSPGADTPRTASGNHASTESETSEDLKGDDATVPSMEAEEASLLVPRGAMPPPLRGSLESLERQNTLLTSEGLERIEDEDDLAARIANGLLVPVPVSSGLVVNGNLPENHRYCRPWTARFLKDLARAHEALFHRPLEVSSAVRTVAYQKRLMRINGNAAPAEGDVVSPHMTGATIDIAKSGLTRSEMGWMRHRLLELEVAGKIDVEEEFHQRCFHITVYKTYAPARPVHRIAPSRAQTPAPAVPAEPDAKPDETAPAETVGAAQGI